MYVNLLIISILLVSCVQTDKKVASKRSLASDIELDEVKSDLLEVLSEDNKTWELQCNMNHSMVVGKKLDKLIDNLSMGYNSEKLSRYSVTRGLKFEYGRNSGVFLLEGLLSSPVNPQPFKTQSALTDDDKYYRIEGFKVPVDSFYSNLFLSFSRLGSSNEFYGVLLENDDGLGSCVLRDEGSASSDLGESRAVFDVSPQLTPEATKRFFLNLISQLIGKRWQLMCNIIDDTRALATQFIGIGTPFNVGDLLSMKYYNDSKTMFGIVQNLRFIQEANRSIGTLWLRGLKKKDIPVEMLIRGRDSSKGAMGYFKFVVDSGIRDLSISLAYHHPLLPNRFQGILFLGDDGIGACLLEPQDE